MKHSPSVNGRSLSARLPEDFHHPESLAEVKRLGDGSLLEPANQPAWPSGFFEEIVIEDPAFVRPRQGEALEPSSLHEWRICLPSGTDAAREDARIRAALESAGRIIGPYDLLLVGQSLALDVVLVTRNSREFQRVPGLSLGDWEAGDGGSWLFLEEVRSEFRDLLAQKMAQPSPVAAVDSVRWSRQF